FCGKKLLMPRLTIRNLKNTEVYVEINQPVLKALQAQYIDWMQACGGKGRCTTCAMQVIEGQASLSVPTLREQHWQIQKRLKEDERLACQTTLSEDCIVVVPSNYQLPHLHYSE
ncbi:MAG: 2Fe-2S iron-sulfur cluster-binding protein, partial [Bacteroidota bacterium]